MSMVFVDTAYWIAITDPSDQWNAVAKQAMDNLGVPFMVTTEDVLAEFLTTFANSGPTSRTRAAQAVRMIQADTNVEVIQRSHESFNSGLARYENRPDKGYSLQDCVSMNVMDQLGITQILTSDHHFEQEGYSILMRPI